MEGMKNKAAQELSRKRWEKTDQQNFRAFQKLDGARRIERNEWLGRPFNPNRCPCGKMTKDRAEKRNHKCQSI